MTQNDADQDDICVDIDDCPYDAENDADQDGICGDLDECLWCREWCRPGWYLWWFRWVSIRCRKWWDQDGICGDVDECPYDADNDIDSDGQCGDVDPCPFDALDDSDIGSCDSDDICPGENDFIVQMGIPLLTV